MGDILFAVSRRADYIGSKSLESDGPTGIVGYAHCCCVPQLQCSVLVDKCSFLRDHH